SYKIGIQKVFTEKVVVAGRKKLISELENLEKELEMLKQVQHDEKEIKKVETVPEPEKGNVYLIWNGKDLEDFGISANSFDDFREKAFKKFLDPKDEFETENEFQERANIFEKEKNFLNLYFGKQEIEMTYSPEKAEFDVKVNFWNISIDFQIEIPRNIARNFKSSVKNFDFYFSKDLVLEKVSTNFENKTFVGKIKKIDLVEIEREREREREEIASKTITVGNLMFQDFDLPEPMNWESACEYCEKLRLLGFSNWRLPNKDELKIVEKNKNSFRNLKSNWYWSSSKSNDSRSWVVYFNDGNDGWGIQTYDYFAVCVRDL
ncbi:Protein of unknown function (DUF1566), partial [Thiovulum sp. ES]